MKTIYKYPFSIDDSVIITMPVGAEILTVQVQHRVPCIWALVDPEAPKVDRYFRVAGTGHSLPENPGKYVGTFQQLEGNLIFHVFDRGEKP
jgi:hypothetical protein